VASTAQDYSRDNTLKKAEPVTPQTFTSADPKTATRFFSVKPF
jgi:hypothetical protein